MSETPEPRGEVRVVVIPAAGLGTRLLPATKAQPKEMLPVVDTPAIQYVVEEAVNAGLTDILMITGRGKSSMEDHFDRAPELEAALRSKGDEGRLAAVLGLADLARVHSVRQIEPLGLGHAVACARDHVGQRPFAVMLGDDLIDPSTPVLDRMARARSRHGGSVLCLLPVPDDQIGRYGCAAVEPIPGTDEVRVIGLVEKPAPGTAPSNLAVVGRYVLDPAVFAELAGTRPGHGGEIQLTDALSSLIDRNPTDGGGVTGVVFEGRRYDTGDKLSYLQSVVRIACDRPDLGPDLRKWLVDLVGEFRREGG